MDAIRDLSRAGCLHLDQQDALSSFRENFLLPEGLIYLDGNPWARRSMKRRKG